MRGRRVLSLLAGTGALLSFVSAPAAAQAPGRIVGRVVDAAQGAPIAGAQVELVGGGAIVVSALDGRFNLTGIVAGPATVRVRMIGYNSKLVSGIAVRAGEATTQDISLEAATVEVAEITVTSEAERGSVSRALDEQRNAVGVVNAVSREQIQRSPDSDAGQAVQRVSGVTVQDGKYVFVRGLGERYTTTSLNGARVPSPEPERKVVPLDMFPSALIETITTSKTYTPDQSGDFSGAQVDIRTREFPGRRQIALSATSGFNTEATRSSVPAAPTNGGEWLALADGRDVPRPVANAGDLQQALPQAAVNQMVSSFRPAWSARERAVMPNMSFGLNTGGTQALFGRPIGYLVSGTYSISQEAQTHQVRGVAIAGSEPGSTVQADRYVGTTGRTGVLWGGLLNLSTALGDRTRVALNNTYNRTADNDARHETGTSENLGLNLAIDRLRYVERAIRSSQLSAVHQIGSQSRLDWSATTSGVTRREPDRSEIVYARDEAEGGTYRWLSGSNEGAVRTFGDLTESSLEGSANLTLGLGPTASAPAVKFGALARRTTRDAGTAAYSISAPGLSAADRALTPEEIFDGRFADPEDAVFRISPLAQGGAYKATDRLLAGYAMGDIGLASGVRLVAGARLESSEVAVTAEPTIGAPVTTAPGYLDVLPSAAVNFNVTERHTLRFSVSQTLSRPEYRELAEVQYREVLGGDNVVGNPGLRRTLIRNADLRWEWYPGQGEIVSLGVFAKQFDSPIERIYLATSGTRLIRYVNAEAARNYGVELDFRKNLGIIAPALAGFSAFANATVMHSDVEIGASDASKTNDNRAMVGQAPYVVNAGLTFATGGRASATALVNRVGRRIVSASEAPLPDIYEEPRTVVDFSLRFPLAEGLSGRFDARNLLDAAYEVTQGTVVRESFRTGRVFQLGFSWTL